MEIVGIKAVQILLLAIVFLSLLAEIKTGGMGIAALLGLVAAGIFFGGQYAKGLVSFYHIAVFLAGILCIIIEILTPATGLFAGIGVAALLYSFILALGADVNALYVLFASAVLSLLAFAAIVRKLPASRFWKKIVLPDQPGREQGYIAAEDKRGLIGREGIVLTELRPSGTALIDNRKEDVVSEGEFLPKGERIRVVAVHGRRIIVDRVDS